MSEGHTPDSQKLQADRKQWIPKGFDKLEPNPNLSYEECPKITEFVSNRDFGENMLMLLNLNGWTKRFPRFLPTL